MWLVSGRTNLTSGRESFTGSGLIDWFFDYWLPVFVHEVRYSMLRKMFVKEGKSKEDAHDEALLLADERYQEVNSKDGISEACEKKGRAAYEGKDALTDYEKEGKAEHKETAQKFDSWLGQANQTPTGKSLQRMFMAEDIHEEAQDESPGVLIHHASTIREA